MAETAALKNDEEINLSNLLELNNEVLLEYVNNKDNQNIKTEKNERKNIKNISDDSFCKNIKNNLVVNWDSIFLFLILLFKRFIIINDKFLFTTLIW